MSDRQTNFDLIVVDPPWPQRKGGHRKVRPNQGANLDYKTLSVSEIFYLLDKEIFPLCTPAHTVFLWSIDKFLNEAEERMRERGYKLHARLIWNKLNGVCPAFSVRFAHEYVLWFYKGNFKTPYCSGVYTTVFTEKARQHSRKPDIFYSMVADLYPQASKLDVFSREPRTSWEQWGDQLTHFSKEVV